MNLPRIRRRGVLVLSTAIAAVMAPLAIPSASGAIIDQSASAFALKADTLATSPITVSEVSAAGTQGPVTKSVVSVDVPPILHAAALTATAQAKSAPGAFSKASAEVARVDLNALALVNLDIPLVNDLIKIPLLNDVLELDLKALVSVVRSRCHLDAHKLVAESTILDTSAVLKLLATLNGAPLQVHADAEGNVSFPPNTTIDLGLVKIILNEQIIEGGVGFDFARVTVNGLRVVVPNIADVVVSSASCFIKGSGPNGAIDFRHGTDFGTPGVILDLNLNLDLNLANLIPAIGEITLPPINVVVDDILALVPAVLGQVIGDLDVEGVLDLSLLEAVGDLGNVVDGDLPFFLDVNVIVKALAGIL